MELRLLLTRHCSHCLFVKNQGRCSFGLFNYYSYVSFRASGGIWGIWELVAELVYLLTSRHSSLSLPCGRPIIKMWKPSVRGLPGSRAGCTRFTNRDDEWTRMRWKHQPKRREGEACETALLAVRAGSECHRAYISAASWAGKLKRWIKECNYFVIVSA